MQTLDYQLLDDPRKQLGLIVLQSDITLEDEFRYYFADQPVSLLANRIPFENEVTPDTLRAMQGHIGNTMSLFPPDIHFDAVGYACTSGALNIGSEQIKQLVQDERETAEVTDPLLAAKRAMQHINAKRIAYLAPYSQTVSQQMLAAFEAAGIVVAASATFNESQDRLVGRIAPDCIKDAAIELCSQAENIDAVFIACTNMKCASVIPDIEAATGVTALSSNLVLAWDMARLAGCPLVAPDKAGLCAMVHN